jgi:pumilio RNA-binding family
LKLSEVLEKIESNAKDQTGSRFLQMTMDEDNEEDMHCIFEAMLPFLTKLATDQFGNFVVQKLVAKGTDAQKEAIAQELKGDSMKLSIDKFGCRVVQKAMETMRPDLQIMVAQEIKTDVMGCIKSMHGNHVIQKCVENLQPEDMGFIIDAVENQVEFTATHMYGCRVMQRLLERHPRESDSARNRLDNMLDLLMKHIPKLAKDQHGNYVVQCILHKGRLEDKQHIIQTIYERPLEYAKNKCSSNVVERCLEISADAAELEDERQKLMQALIGRPADPAAPLRDLMADKFGNFIVSKMIKHSRGSDRDMLRKELEMEEPTLRNSQSGRHILTTMEKEFGD